MTSLKQIAANRLNALKGTGPRTAFGKRRSRQNALRHGLTAESVISALEHAADYRALQASIIADYQPQSATERELVLRLASVLWRLRRATHIETGLFQAEADLLQKRNAEMAGSSLPPPEWSDEHDSGRPVNRSAIDPQDPDREGTDLGQALADCFLHVSRMGYGAFYLLSRYESALWRQAAQLLFLLQSGAAARRHPRAAAVENSHATASPSDQASVVRLVPLTKRRRKVRPVVDRTGGLNHG